MTLILAKKTPILLLCTSLLVSSLLAVSVWKMHTARVEERHASMTRVVDLGISSLRYFGARAHAGKLSKEEAQAQARELIKALRYGETGYLTIVNLEGEVVMHPFQPELNGKNMLGFQDARGTYLYKDIVGTARSAAGSGFVDYMWQRPGDSVAATKTSRVAAFPEWGWILVAGEYTDDIALEWKNFLGR